MSNGGKCFLILAEEKNIFKKEFESFYFLFLLPTCKLEKKREKNVFEQVLQSVKLFLFLNKKFVFRKCLVDYFSSEF